MISCTTWPHNCKNFPWLGYAIQILENMPNSTAWPLFSFCFIFWFLTIIFTIWFWRFTEDFKRSFFRLCADLVVDAYCLNLTSLFLHGIGSLPHVLSLYVSFQSLYSMCFLFQNSFVSLILGFHCLGGRLCICSSGQL